MLYHSLAIRNYLLSFASGNEKNPDFDTWNCLGQPTLFNFLGGMPIDNLAVNCPTFYETLYPAFKQRFDSMIRSLDEKHMIEHDLTLYETLAQLPVITKLLDPNTLIGRSTYFENNPFQAYIVNVTQDTAGANNAGFIVTEFGANIDPVADLPAILKQFDSRQISWTYWNFRTSQLTGVGENEGDLLLDPALPPTGSNIDQVKLAALVEPYPQVIAGTPISYSYDPSSNIFNFTYSALSTDRCSNSSPKLLTEVYIPKSKYPNGYNVQVTGAEILSKKNAQLLVLKRKKCANIVTQLFHSASKHHEPLMIRI